MDPSRSQRERREGGRDLFFLGTCCLVSFTLGLSFLFSEEVEIEKTDNGDIWTSPDKGPAAEPTVVVKGQTGQESYEPAPAVAVATDSTPVELEKLSYQFCELTGPL